MPSRSKLCSEPDPPPPLPSQPKSPRSKQRRSRIFFTGADSLSDPADLQDSSATLKINPDMIAALGEHRPILETGVWIADSADVVGRVHLAENVSVWFAAVLRADNESITVGRGSNLQDGAVVHVDPGFPCVIGERCVIGHRAVLHGCTLGNEVLVGIGAIVLNGAVIPDGCLIGAGALVPEGLRLEPDSLYVGIPARKARELTADDRARIRRNAEGYIARAQRFASELQTISKD